MNPLLPDAEMWYWVDAEGRVFSSTVKPTGRRKFVSADEAAEIIEAARQDYERRMRAERGEVYSARELALAARTGMSIEDARQVLQSLP